MLQFLDPPLRRYTEAWETNDDGNPYRRAVHQLNSVVHTALPVSCIILSSSAAEHPQSISLYWPVKCQALSVLWLLGFFVLFPKQQSLNSVCCDDLSLVLGLGQGWAPERYRDPPFLESFFSWFLPTLCISFTLSRRLPYTMDCILFGEFLTLENSVRNAPEQTSSPWYQIFLKC